MLGSALFERTLFRYRTSLIVLIKALVVNESMAGMEDAMADADTEEALAEFDFLVTEGGEGAGEARSHGDGEWGKCVE